MEDWSAELARPCLAAGFRIQAMQSPRVSAYVYAAIGHDSLAARGDDLAVKGLNPKYAERRPCAIRGSAAALRIVVQRGPFIRSHGTPARPDKRNHQHKWQRSLFHETTSRQDRSPESRVSEPGFQPHRGAGRPAMSVPSGSVLGQGKPEPGKHGMFRPRPCQIAGVTERWLAMVARSWPRLMGLVR